MTMEEFIDHAASWGISAVELTSYYFADSTPTYFASLKGRCTRLGLDVSGGTIGNNFCLRDPAKLRKEIDHVKRGTEAISLLGGKTLRIFAGSLEKGDSEDAARPRIVEAIQEACDHAAKLGGTWRLKTMAESLRRPIKLWPSSRRSSTIGSE